MDQDKASPNWAFLSRYDIVHDGRLYLRRWRLFECPLFGIYFHKIYRPDRDRDLHDHPWPFVSFVLKGFYEEELPCPGNNCGYGYHIHINYVRWFNKKKATDSHRIKAIQAKKLPVWTLVLRGRRCRVWGFHTKDGWVPWNEYLEGR